MRILLAGATGAIGRPLVPALLGAGHEVWGLTRSQERATALEALGAHGVVGDALDRSDVERAAAEAEPEVVMQQLTALPHRITPKAMAEGFEQTSRLRTEGTANLMAAAPGARVIAQSIAFAHDPQGGWVKTEDDPLFTAIPQIAALERMERSVVDAGGTVLRYGYFYGPGTWYARDGEYGRMARRRMLPVVGRGDATSSFLHVDDAVTATLAALARDVPGVFHVVDDHPAPQREWVPAFCAAAGAKRPRRLPAWLMRRLAGPVGAHFLTEVRGADGTRFKQAYGWQPRHADWREGFSTL